MVKLLYPNGYLAVGGQEEKLGEEEGSGNDNGPSTKAEGEHH